MNAKSRLCESGGWVGAAVILAQVAVQFTTCLRLVPHARFQPRPMVSIGHTTGLLEGNGVGRHRFRNRRDLGCPYQPQRHVTRHQQGSCPPSTVDSRAQGISIRTCPPPPHASQPFSVAKCISITVRDCTDDNPSLLI